MRKARWLADWLYCEQKPVIYHCVSRIVDKGFVLHAEEKEKFRTFMRMYERFSGCPVLSYCLMDNHVHLLLEVPPMPDGGLSDEELLHRVSALHNEAEMELLSRELAEARGVDAKVPVGDATCLVADPVTSDPGTSDPGWSPDGVALSRRDQIHARYTRRMHNLSQFMKALLQRYSQWHNRRHKRSGHLWESRFKSLIVESGETARTMAAYIDLNPVRAGMVNEPADYRWSSYGEAIGGGAEGNGKTARAGLVRVMRAHQGGGADDSMWKSKVARAYRKVLMAGAAEKTETKVVNGVEVTVCKRKGMSAEKAARGVQGPEGIAYGKILRCRVRYFTDGAVIGSRAFVNEAFHHARERFGPKRVDGARKMRGEVAAVKLWSMRDLRVGV